MDTTPDTGPKSPAAAPRLAGQTDLAGFRSEARLLLAQQVPPEEVQWQLQPVPEAYSDAQSPQSSRPRNVARAATAIVPASFTRLCEFVVMHRDPARFALLYRLLWRLVHEPRLRGDPMDADMQQAQHMAHAVRRDIHKMKANLRMRLLQTGAGIDLQAGCYEPTHHVVEAVAPWFAKRASTPRWAIFTPHRSVRWEEGRLLFGPGVACAALPQDDAPAADWLAVYERVFGAHDRPAAHA
ncbi:MAG: uracil-DNA glycosylase protein-like protein [Ramlibacter sp.]|nr:uracil-DNA glycosylase protein-like protein [Ramlibacter sp.]MDB5913045.1 uracil-DNA glycosylase protein-like protein [Ramlibacter sp.]